jgi:O-acetylserine/cysteine efflux transporter
LLSNVDVGKISPFLMLLPVTSIIAGVVLLDEQITVVMIIGGLMIMTGVASTLVDWRWQKEQPNL